jgi:hypothetical protein
LLDFASQHPADFPARATFFINQDPNTNDSVFGTADIASFKLQMLQSWGFEIGLMAGAAAGDELTGETAQAESAAAKQRLEVLLPGYVPVSLSLPGGGTLQAPEPLRGAAVDNDEYVYAAAVLPDGGLAPSPFIPGFNPLRIPRLPAGEPGGSSWREAIAGAELFVSAGE